MSERKFYIDKMVKFKELEYKMHYDLVENIVCLDELFGEEKQHVFTVDVNNVVNSIKDTILDINDIKINYENYRALIEWDGEV